MNSLGTNTKQKIVVLITVLVLFSSLSYILYLKYQPKPFSGEGKIDIGGYSLYLNSRGVGTPTIIFESGGNSPARFWEIVPKEIAKHTRTIIYDRAGVGESDISPKERTADVIAEELHILLKKANIKGPYIFVGHSAGGIYARMYAAMYPDDVAGLVLLDVTNEDRDIINYENFTTEQLEEVRILEEQEMSNPLSPNMKYVETNAAFYESSKQIMQMRDHIKDIPVTVIASGILIDLDNDSNRLEYQKEIAARFDHSKFIIAADSGHSIHLDQYQLVVDEIMEMINSLK